MKAWYEDARILGQLPWRLRLVAGYMRFMLRRQPPSYRSRGFILGGSFLIRAVGAAAGLAARSNERALDLGDIRIVCDLSDTRFPHVVGEAQSDSADAWMLRQLLRPGDTFIDVGANHGSFAVRASTLVGVHGQVIAFEPQAHLARLVEHSLRLNAAAPFSVHASAVGDEDGVVALRVPVARSGSATIRPIELRGRVQTREVPITRLDSALRDLPPRGRTVIKIDVEGNELSVLQGAAASIDSRRPAMILELSPATTLPEPHLLAEILGLLEIHAYVVAEYSTYPLAVRPNSVDLSRQRNVVALPLGGPWHVTLQSEADPAARGTTPQ